MLKFMRQPRYFIFIFFVLLSNSCINKLETNISYQNSNYLATQSAIHYFKTLAVDSTRSADELPTESAPYILGNYLPHWDTGKTIIGNDLYYSEFKLSKEYHYLLFPNYDSDIAAVNLHSRYISIANNDYQTLNQYIITYIPAPNYIDTYRDIVNNDELHCQNWNNFSGVVLFSMLSGHHLAAYQFVDGLCHKRSLLYDTNLSVDQRIDDFLDIMNGISIGIVTSNDTRSDAIFGGTIELIEIVYNTTFPIIIIDVDDDNNTIISNPLEPIIDDRIGGNNNGGNDDEEEKSIREYSEDLFDTKSLTFEEKVKLDEMLKAILDDCMGNKLYEDLVNNNEKIKLSFRSDINNSRFGVSQGTMTIDLTRKYRSDILLHEMMHAHQYINKNTDLINNSVCCEIEAYIASLAFVERTLDSISFINDYQRYCPRYIVDETLLLVYLFPTPGVSINEFHIQIYNSYFNDAAMFYSARYSNKTYQRTDGYTFTKSLIDLSSNC
ncbi:MAG: hypothetical protein J6V28_03395 [Tidjanibacter sp.]|nr:hypothetical protein [Tidjanibacter sp.]